MGKKSREKAERREAAAQAPASVRETTLRDLKKGRQIPLVDQLAATVAERDRLELEVERLAVELRDSGASWGVIASALGIARQSAHSRFGGK